MSPSSANGLQSLRMHNLAFTVADIEKTIHWYETTLGFQVLSRTAMPAIGAQIAFLQLTDIQLEALQAKDGFRLDELFADALKHLLPIGYCWRIGFKSLLVESIARKQPDGSGLTVLRSAS